jgi:antitoxin component YwqK of YwqJK toxin-antitoxin module
MFNNVKLLMLGVCFSHYCYAQDVTLREIIIKKDTAYEINNLKRKFTVVEPKNVTGATLIAVDSPSRIFTFSEIKNSVTEGVYLEFYIPSDMPKVRGEYLNGKKNGYWFFWSENGKLIRREEWKNDRKVSRS